MISFYTPPSYVTFTNIQRQKEPVKPQLSVTSCISTKIIFIPSSYSHQPYYRTKNGIGKCFIIKRIHMYSSV